MTLQRVFLNILLLLLFSKLASARASDPKSVHPYQSYRWNIKNDPFITDLYLDDQEHILWVKVHTEGSKGVWNAVPATLTMVHSPPWWASTIAYMLYGMIILGLTCALRFYLLRYIKLKPKPAAAPVLHHRDIVLQPSRASPVSADERLLKRVLEYVEERIDDSDLSIDEICAKIGLSRTQLYRKMKALTDLSMAELIKQIRLQRAQELLKGRKFHINEVCYMVGFTNSDYFRKCFKAHFGLAPTAYTKQQLVKMNQEAEASRLMKITTSQGFDNSYSDRVSSLRR